MKYMVWKHADRNDERWVYIPSLNFSSRVQSKEKRYNFGKFHFTYEDLTGRKIDDDNYEMIYSNGSKHYMIKGIPKNLSSVDFSYYHIYIRAEDFIPVKVEFMHDDELIRLIEVMNMENIQGYPTITRALIKDLRAGGETIMEFSNIKYDAGLAEDMFDESFLRSESKSLGETLIRPAKSWMIMPINAEKLPIK